MACLRLVTQADTDFLCAVYASTRAAELAATGWSPEQKAQFCAAQFHAQDTYYRQHYPGAQFAVIERAGEPMGRLYVARWPQEIRIMDITLLPAYCGQGIGTTLLRALQEEAAASSRTLSIHVERLNPAQRLYARLGFQLKEDKGVYLLLEWRPPVS